MLQVHRSTGRHVTDITDSFIIINNVFFSQVATPILSLVMSSKKVRCPLTLSLDESVLRGKRSAHVMNVLSSLLSFSPFPLHPFHLLPRYRRVSGVSRHFNPAQNFH